MRVDVVMPQMGESIAEGTITRWMQAGRRARLARRADLRDLDRQGGRRDPLARRGNARRDPRTREGETVPVNQVVAVLETDGPAPQPAAQPAPARRSDPRRAAPAPQPPGLAPRSRRPRRETARTRALRLAGRAQDRRASTASTRARPGNGRRRPRHEEGHPGFRRQGRRRARGARRRTAPAAAAAPQPARRHVRAGRARRARSRCRSMRKKIAEHMIESRRTSAHVHSVFEVDMTPRRQAARAVQGRLRASATGRS